MSYTIRGFQEVGQHYGSHLHGPPWLTDYERARYAFARIKACHGNTIRFGVDWSHVQPTQGVAPNFESTDPERNYSGVRALAKEHQLRVVPICLGCPSWAAPVWNGNYIPGQPQTPANRTYYPGQAAAGAFGEFVVATLKYFDEEFLVDAIEVWNEPNLKGGHTYIGFTNRNANPITHSDDTASYSRLLGEALYRIEAQRPTLNIPSVGILGGSLSMGGNNPNWHTYFVGINNQCYPWALSIHPYCNQPSNINQVVSEICTKYISADILVSNNNQQVNDIWVTETGAPSAGPLDENGQASVISQVSAYLHQRPRCKAMLVYRLYDAGNQDVPTPFANYAAHRPDWSEKPVCPTLRSIWPPP